MRYRSSTELTQRSCNRSQDSINCPGLQNHQLTKITFSFLYRCIDIIIFIFFLYFLFVHIKREEWSLSIWQLLICIDNDIVRFISLFDVFASFWPVFIFACVKGWGRIADLHTQCLQSQISRNLREVTAAIVAASVSQKLALHTMPASAVIVPAVNLGHDWPCNQALCMQKLSF